MEIWRKTTESLLNEDYNRNEPARVEKRRKKSIGYEDPSGDGSWVTGKKEMDTLAHGIVEKEKKLDCRSGNKRHDKDGKFSTVKDSRSWSGGYDDSNRTDCKAGKFKTKGTKKKFITRHKCGRKKDGSKEEFKCKDGSKAYQQESIENPQTEDEIRQARIYDIATIQQAVKDAMKQATAGRTGCRLQDVARILNTIELGSKGQLYDKEKHDKS